MVFLFLPDYDSMSLQCQVARKLVILEGELERAEERAEIAEL